jgi:hypothetical protein
MMLQVGAVTEVRIRDTSEAEIAFHHLNQIKSDACPKAVDKVNEWRQHMISDK